MKEDFLHYIWNLQLFDHADLKTTTGDALIIGNPGKHNFDQGPDFLEGKVIISGTVWAGNIEIHVNSGDWLAHKHQTDLAYENVVLHVVWEEDVIIYRKDGTAIPCLELAHLVKPELRSNYDSLMSSSTWIPCEKFIPEVQDHLKISTLDKMIIDRLEEKTGRILLLLQELKNDWDDAFYRVLSRYFAMGVNAHAFEVLASSLPFRILLKHRNSPKQLEAMLYGQAGMLEKKFKDDYPDQLKKEYDFLRRKYDLQPMNEVIWKFNRMRPVNFPTIRISQFASLLTRADHLFDRTMMAVNLKEIYHLFSVQASRYWEDHFRFEVPSTARSRKALGEEFIKTLTINAVVPFMFLYGTLNGHEVLREKSIRLLEQIKPEENAMIRQWKKLKIKPQNASESQALIHLKTKYCQEKNCLSCPIGHSIMNHQ